MHTAPTLVNDPFVALGVTVHFPPWDQFFDFPFRSYSSFRKKIWLTRQKVFPLPTVGAPLPVTALVLSARRPFVRELDKKIEQIAMKRPVFWAILSSGAQIT